jgi:hypothetical protein
MVGNAICIGRRKEGCSFRILDRQFTNLDGVSGPKLMEQTWKVPSMFHHKQCRLNTKNPRKRLFAGILGEGAQRDFSQKKDIAFRRCLFVGCPVGLGRIWWFLIILYMSIIY